MRYTSDLTDAQWEMIKNYIPVGNKSKYEKRELVNAVLYVVKTGCQWRNLPSDFPKWKAVYAFFFRSKEKGIWEKIMQFLVKEARKKAGRREDPSYGLIDSQSVKTIYASDERGIDGGKKQKGENDI